VRQHRAIGTSLAVILPTAIAGAARYHQEALSRHEPGLQLWVVIWLAAGGVIGARMGAVLANRLNAKQLRRTFGVFVIATGAWMIVRALAALPLGTPAPVDFARALEMVGVGVLVGMASGLLGVGGGLVMVPALSLLLGYEQHLAQGTSLAVIIPVSISAGLIHLAAGNVIRSLAWPLALGAVLGAWVMAGGVFSIPQDQLRVLFGVFLLVMGGTMIASRPPRSPRGGETEREEE
jgi:uncharacterized membrane protein YfcA